MKPKSFSIEVIFKVTFLMFTLLCLASFSNCKSLPGEKSSQEHHSNTDCIKPGMEKLAITWGDVILKTGEIDGWRLNAKGEVLRFTREELNSDSIISKTSEIDKSKLCSLISMINSEILKTQALNAPGDISRYVEFYNPETGTNFRAIWNPKFQTVGSKGFRAIYDSLMSVVPEKN